MSDPVLDEENIIDLLRCPVKAATVGRLQAGAVQAMIDLYDRKVTREEFINALAPCITLYGSAAKIWMLANVRAVHEDGDLDTAKFDHAMSALEDLTRKQSETVVEVVKRLIQCPTSQDPVH